MTRRQDTVSTWLQVTYESFVSTNASAGHVLMRPRVTPDPFAGHALTRLQVTVMICLKVCPGPSACTVLTHLKVTVLVLIKPGPDLPACRSPCLNDQHRSVWSPAQLTLY